MTDSSPTDKGSPEAGGAPGRAAGGAGSGRPGAQAEGKGSGDARVTGGKSLRQPPTIELKASEAPAAASADAPPKPASAAARGATGPAVGAGAAASGAASQAGLAGAPAEREKKAASDSKPAPARSADASRKADAVGTGGDNGGAPPPAGKAGLGFAGGLLAAIIGGAAGVAGAWAVSVIHPGSIATIQQDGSLEQRLSMVEQDLNVRINALAPKSEVASVVDRLAALDAKLGQLATEVRDLAGRAAATPTGAAPSEAAAAAPDAAAAIAAANAAAREQFAALGERLTQVEQAAQHAGAQAAAVAGQLKALEGAVQAVDPAVAQGAVRAAGEAMRQVAALDAQMGELGRSLASRSVDPRVADLGRAIAAADALSAIQGGRALQPATAQLALKGGDAATPEAGNLATLSQLQHDFAAVRDRLDAEQHKDEGVLERLTASAARLVRVRPVDPQGRPVAAVEGTVERVGDLLAAGDLAGAAAAWNALPQDMRVLAPAFGAALTARVQAEQKARGALDAALASIARHGADAQPAQGHNQ